MLNLIHELKSTKTSNLYIYGIGEVGLLLYNLLKENDIPVNAYLVSEGYKKPQDYNVLEYNLSNGTVDGERTIRNSIVIVTTQANSENILHSLKKNGAFPYNFSTPEKFLEIYKEYYKDFLETKSSNGINNPTIQLPNFEILNPYKNSINYALSLYLEFADLLMPALNSKNCHYWEGPYELENVHLQKDDVVIDCGSNIGLFTIYAASMDCSVLAFEPDPNNIEYLRFMENQFRDRIKIIPYALSNITGSAKFELSKGISISSKISSSSDDTSEIKDFITIPVIRIDDYVKNNNIEKVDFIKADIEGTERLMLLGAMETLKKYTPKLALCTYHLPDDPKVLEQIILEANPNYIIKHKYKKLYAYVPK